jgi:hypothetical protein
MPIAYFVDTERGVVFSKWDGAVTADDLAQHCKKLFSDERAIAIGRSVADMRGAVIEFSGDDMRQVTGEMVVPAFQKRRWMTAVVVDGPTHYGVTRQFQAHADAFGRSAIFDNEAEALAWLLAK